MSEPRADYGIVTQDVFEYKLLMRVRQLRKSGARLLIDLDTDELQVLGHAESLNIKTMSASVPIATIIAS